jgi:BON domain
MMKSVTVKDVMTTRVVSVGKDASFREMAGAHLVGIISRADVLSVFDRSDEEIRTEIRDQVIRDGFSIDPAAFGVVVKDGVVTLGGRPESCDVGHDLVQRIRRLPGVVAIRDRLTYPSREASDATFDVVARFPAD